MKPRTAFLLGYGAGVGTWLLGPWLHAGALSLASRLLRRVEGSLARAEAERERLGTPMAETRAFLEKNREVGLQTHTAPEVPPRVRTS